MPYIEEIVKAGETIEITRYFSGRFGKHGKRSNPVKTTTESQMKRNDRAAARKLRRIVNANFKKNDYHIVLGYAGKKPETEEDMKKDIRVFLRRLSRRYKKAGQPMKYIYVCEVGKKGARHVHILLNRGVSDEVIQECWTFGRIHTNLLDDKGDYSQLSDYLIKFTTKELHEGRAKQRYSCSRNLVKPKIEKKIIMRNVFRKDPKRKGYYIASKYEGETDMGYSMQHFMLIKGMSLRI